MTRITPFSSPLLLGFETMEKTLERMAKAGDGYPPYNIERLHSKDEHDRLRITLAVAGFSTDDLDVTVENCQLVVRGCQQDAGVHDYLYRGIAARQFERIFMLADGMEVAAAELKNGLLAIDLQRPQPQKIVRRIAISAVDEV